MTTLTLAQLNADLLRIQAHGLTATNVLSLQHTAGGKIYAETDTSEHDKALAETCADLATTNGELDVAHHRIAKLESNLRSFMTACSAHSFPNLPIQAPMAEARKLLP